MAILTKKYVGKKKLGELLVESGKITQEQLQEALLRQKESYDKLGNILLDMGAVTEEDLVGVFCEQASLNRIDLSEITIDADTLTKITCSPDELKKTGAIPYKYDPTTNTLYFAISDPLSPTLYDDARTWTTCRVVFAVTTQTAILAAIDKYYSNLSQEYLVKQYSQERAAEGKEIDSDDAIDTSDTSDSAVVKLVNHLLEQAALKKASDIHIEALEGEVRVRDRIDGDLIIVGTYPLVMLNPLVSRLKIMGGMDISERRKPQDGRITYICGGVEYDIRVSIMPTVYGEKTVMRLAEKKQLKREKSALGFYPDDLEKFDNIISNPHGIILVTGPTGSGKSTTLYTALSELNKENVNIITVEDPVEANVDGINQVQVNNKAEMTFANALRAILRQDPDIIMIGEIRDKETANIAVEASITGHLVVSTLHTNSAVSTITRLENMGIESYLIADSTVGIMAQRLVKRLCPYCKKPYKPSAEEKEQLEIPADDEETKIYKPCGCQRCTNGYKGRIGVYEILPITRTLKVRIADGAQADELEQLALQEGMHSLRMSAMRLVKDGVTDITEMNRVARS